MGNMEPGVVPARIGGISMVQINVDDIRRHTNHIRLGSNRTAKEGRDGNLPTLTIREKGKVIKNYRGSSLCFNDDLTKEDKEYLASLASD